MQKQSFLLNYFKTLSGGPTHACQPMTPSLDDSDHNTTSAINQFLHTRQIRIRRKWHWKSVFFINLMEILICFYYVQDGATPLFVASQNGHTEVVLCLLNCGASVNKCRQVNCLRIIYVCYCMSAHIQCYLGGFLLQDAPSSLKQKFHGKIIIVRWQTKYIKLPQNQFLTEPKHGRRPQTMTSTIMNITESELNGRPLKLEPLMFVSHACRTTHVYYACSRQSIALLANKNAELFVSPLFSPVLFNF